MSVIIQIPRFFQEATGDLKDAAVEGATVRECLNELVRSFPGVKPKLFTGRGKLHSYIEIFINNKSAYPGELDRKVSDGDELRIMNIIMGG
jgi:sulfur-carrier protein